MNTIYTESAVFYRRDASSTHDTASALYCIMRPYTDGRLDRYRIGIPRELSEIRTQPWLSEGSLTCDPCHHRGPIF